MVDTWLAAQVNLMTAATSESQVFAIAAEASSRIASWSIGDVPMEWFQYEVASHPPRKPKTLRRSLITGAQASRGFALSGLIAGILGGVGVALGTNRLNRATCGS